MKGCGKLCDMIQKGLYAYECGKKRKSGLTSYCKECAEKIYLSKTTENKNGN